MHLFEINNETEYILEQSSVHMKDYIGNDVCKFDQFDHLIVLIVPFNRDCNNSIVSTIKLSFQLLLRSINAQSTLRNSIISCRSFLLKSLYGDRFPVYPLCEREKVCVYLTIV